MLAVATAWLGLGSPSWAGPQGGVVSAGSANIVINANLNGGSNAKLAMEYGQGAVAANNTSDYYVNSAINLPAGNNFSTKLGSDGVTKTYTVITALGSAGSASQTDLQGMNGDITKNYALGSDIDASATATWNGGAGFDPIGSFNAHFSGTFAGLGHTISKLTIQRPASNSIGLFVYTDATAVVREIGLVGGSITGSSFVGGLVSSNAGAILRSYNAGAVSGSGAVTGGLAAQNFGSITQSYNTGAVTGGGYSVGGLVGSNVGVIVQSYNVAAVKGGGTSVGGLVGANLSSGSIAQSYSIGDVYGESEVGGLVGTTDCVMCTISQSYSSGAVKGTGQVGGLIGYANQTSTVDKSYWNTDSSGQKSSAGGTGISSDQMRLSATFTGWDIATTDGTKSVWRIYEGYSSPGLQSRLHLRSCASAGPGASRCRSGPAPGPAGGAPTTSAAARHPAFSRDVPKPSHRFRSPGTYRRRARSAHQRGHAFQRCRTAGRAG